jgi:hypothetical protein
MLLRCFVGNLGNEVDDNSLIRAFQAYPSFQRAKVIFDENPKPLAAKP